MFRQGRRDMQMTCKYNANDTSPHANEHPVFGINCRVIH